MDIYMAKKQNQHGALKLHYWLVGTLKSYLNTLKINPIFSTEEIH